MPPELSLPSFGSAGETAPEPAYGELPLAFERDAGRQGPRVDFLARSSAGTTFIGSQGATLALTDGERTEVVRLALQGANPATPQAIDRLPGEVNDLVGADPSTHRAGIATFERIRYRSVYPGIALDWHGTQGSLEYDFRVAPGADPSRIGLEVRGAESLRLAGSGDLVIDTGSATVRQQAPVAYQPSVDGRTLVEIAFAIDGKALGFDLGPYDRSLPLVIDPLVLAYSTYLGGTLGDEARAIAVDSTGAAYVTGNTSSTDFDTVGQVEGDQPGQDIFVSKLNAAGNALIYSTYLGGDGIDDVFALAVDPSGAAYVTGETASSDFNTTGTAGTGHYEGNSAGADPADIFVSKLNLAGNGLDYSTYIGGTSGERGTGIAVDSSGAAYILGFTTGAGYDVTGDVGSGHIEGPQGSADLVITKLAPAGNALTYSTYLGGSSIDTSAGIALDSSGAAYITGSTGSSDFDTVGPIEGPSGSTDAIVSKIVPAGNALAYSTYLGGGVPDGGGNAVDQGFAIAVDSAGSAYITGQTNSTDYPVVGQIEGNSTFNDAIISKLTPAGNALAYSTYLGGDHVDFGNAIAVDSAGAAYVTGQTRSTDFDVVAPIEADPSDSDADAFVSKIAPAGSSLSDSTYLGGNASDGANGIAVDPSGAAYVTGVTGSTDFDTVNPIEGDSASTDAFVAKLTFTATTPPDSPPTDPPTPTPPPASKTARMLTLDASKSKVKKGKKVNLTGEIEADGSSAACEANQTVELQRTKKGTNFADFKTATTDAKGAFSTKVKVKKTFIYRAELTESASCEDDLSNTEKVKAKKKRK